MEGGRCHSAVMVGTTLRPCHSSATSREAVSPSTSTVVHCRVKGRSWWLPTVAVFMMMYNLYLLHLVHLHEALLGWVFRILLSHPWPGSPGYFAFAQVTSAFSAQDISHLHLDRYRHSTRLCCEEGLRWPNRASRGGTLFRVSALSLSPLFSSCVFYLMWPLLTDGSTLLPGSRVCDPGAEHTPSPTSQLCLLGFLSTR